MYIIDQDNNRITKLKQRTFSELGIRERQHLQEWIANLPESLGEELLIIQKEFDGFNDTNERLDLLALDKDRNIVIIENKLDDTGRDVTWQAVKYAFYCSTLSKDQIRNIYQSYLDKIGSKENAVDNISDFYKQEYDEIPLNTGNSQRIILIASNFIKEVTSTVLWLMNYKLRIQCFKAIPFSLNEQLFLTLEQIIPTKDTEEFIISMADKNQTEILNQENTKTRHNIRTEFWTVLLPKLKGKTQIFQNSSPTKDHWISAGGTNIRHARYNLLITKKHAGVQLEFGRPNKDENKLLFDGLRKYENDIESAFGSNLVWNRLDDKISSRLGFYLNDVSIFNRDNWDAMQKFLVEKIIKFELALRPYLITLKPILTNNDDEESNEDDIITSP